MQRRRKKEKERKARLTDARRASDGAGPNPTGEAGPGGSTSVTSVADTVRDGVGVSLLPSGVGGGGVSRAGANGGSWSSCGH